MSDSSDRLSTPYYTDTRALSRATATGFVLMAAVCWTAAGFDIAELRSVGGGDPDPLRTLAHQKAGLLLRQVQLLCAALLAAMFLPWLYQVRANLRAFGLLHLRFSRDWTYLGFAVPVVNTYRPLQVMSEVWCGSVSPADDPVAWRGLARPGLVTTWWLCFVSGIAVGGAAAIGISAATSVSARLLGHAFAFTADASAALSASLGCLIVAGVQRAQEQRSAERGGVELREELVQGQLVA